MRPLHPTNRLGIRGGNSRLEAGIGKNPKIKLDKILTKIEK